jgi:hypothetical protein
VARSGPSVPARVFNSIATDTSAVNISTLDASAIAAGLLSTSLVAYLQDSNSESVWAIGGCVLVSDSVTIIQ